MLQNSQLLRSSEVIYNIEFKPKPFFDQASKEMIEMCWRIIQNTNADNNLLTFVFSTDLHASHRSIEMTRLQKFTSCQATEALIEHDTVSTTSGILKIKLQSHSVSAYTWSKRLEPDLDPCQLILVTFPPRLRFYGAQAIFHKHWSP